MHCEIMLGGAFAFSNALLKTLDQEQVYSFVVKMHIRHPFYLKFHVFKMLAQ